MFIYTTIGKILQEYSEVLHKNCKNTKRLCGVGYDKYNNFIKMKWTLYFHMNTKMGEKHLKLDKIRTEFPKYLKIIKNLETSLSLV